MLPERVVERAALGGKADETPARMRAVGLDDLDGFVGGQRALEHGRVAEETVELGEDELGDGHVFLALNRGQPGIGRVMPGRVLVEGVQQDVGINREHGPISGADGRATAPSRSAGPAP